MMESLLKKSYGLKDKNTSIAFRTFEETHSKNCNICRNFANILERSHRLSTSHQNNLTRKLKIIKSKMKMIRYDSISVHDHQKDKEEMWCYFCDKTIKKHQAYEGCTVQYLGFLSHLTDSQHAEAVKSYLKYHHRKEKFELFCRTNEDLKKFLDKIPEAKKKYLSKLDFIHQKDVAQLKEVEAQRQLLVSEALQAPISANIFEAVISGKEESVQETSNISRNISKKQNAILPLKPKICPWLEQSEKCDGQQVLAKPVIGPTIDTLKKHAADQKKKSLPVKRLGANFQRKQAYSSHWLPSFSGIWNKGRHRQIKSTSKHTR